MSGTVGVTAAPGATVRKDFIVGTEGVLVDTPCFKGIIHHETCWSPRETIDSVWLFQPRRESLPCTCCFAPPSPFCT